MCWSSLWRGSGDKAGRRVGGQGRVISRAGLLVVNKTTTIIVYISFNLGKYLRVGMLGLIVSIRVILHVGNFETFSK